MMPKVDTFEGDISDEIKRKEASLTEISAASNNVGNNDDIELPKRTPMLFITLIVFFILCILGLGSLAYFYFTDPLLSPPAQGVPLQQNTIPKSVADIKNVSPTLAEQIGRFVTHVEKKDAGYSITINNYSSVFAYMTRNEKDYIEELALLFASFPVATSTKAVVIKATTTPQALSQVAQSTSTTASSSLKTTKTDTATSTKVTGSTSTIVISTTTPPVITTPIQEVTVTYFSDVTISNQNMRIWKQGDRTVVYAFVGNATILLSNSTEGILALKSAILR